MSPQLTWQQVPLVRFLLPMMLGAGLYLFFPTSSPSLFTFTGIAILLSFFLIPHKYLWAALFLMITMGIGYLHFAVHDKAFNLPLSPKDDTIDYRLLIAYDIDYDKQKDRWKGVFEHHSAKHATPFKVYAWIENNRKIHKLQAGDSVWVHSTLQKPSRPDVPGEFDFRAYLQRKNIPYTSYINASDVVSFHPSSNSEFWHSVNNWRQTQKHQLYSYTDTVAANLLNAILFGDADQLSPETRAQFTNVGIAHVLAVSGMHVGILILIIQLIVHSIFRPSKRRKWIHFISILVFVWIYVSLCDFAASACRAALMASLYYFGKSLNIKASGMNALAASGLILFLIDPFYLLDLGTQLSFAAMGGILLTFSAIESIFIRRLSLPRKLSSLIAISFAAQLGVAPLIFFYFDRLPMVFWIFSIPAAYFAMILFTGGWLVVLFQNVWPLLAKYTGILLSKCCNLFLGIISCHSYIPLPGIEVIYFPLLYVGLSYVVISLFIILLFAKSKKQIYRVLKSGLLVLVLWNCIHHYETQKVYFFPVETDRKTSLCIIVDQSALLLSDQKIEDSGQLTQTLKQAYPIDTVKQKVIPPALYAKMVDNVDLVLDE